MQLGLALRGLLGCFAWCSLQILAVTMLTMLGRDVHMRKATAAVHLSFVGAKQGGWHVSTSALRRACPKRHAITRASELG
jgi:hypothetical protein